jgi:FkbM family methyltransferase
VICPLLFCARFASRTAFNPADKFLLSYFPFQTSLSAMIRKAFVALRWAANHPMKRGSKTDAVLSFLRSQIGARLVPGEVCVAFPNHTHLLVPARMKGSFHFIWPGIYDFEEMSFVMHFLRPGDLFVDAGANIGVYTVLASGVAGARAIAFEPDLANFGFLKKNVWLNNLAALVDPRNLALGDQEKTIHFTTGLGTENHVVPDGRPEKSVEVVQSSLDRQMNGLEPTVIKIDVEGFEREVLAGFRDGLTKPSLRALLIERGGNAGQQSEAALHETIRSWGFVPCGYLPLTRTLRRIPDESCGNIIYVRNLEAANARLASAPAYHFSGRTI